MRKKTLDGARRVGERDQKRGPHFEKKGLLWAPFTDSAELEKILTKQLK